MAEYDPGRAARQARRFLHDLERTHQPAYDVMLARYQEARAALVADIERITKGVPDASKLPLRQDELLRALDRRIEQYLRVVNARGSKIAAAAAKAGLETGAAQMREWGIAQGVDVNQYAVGALQGSLTETLGGIQPAARSRAAGLLSQAVTLGWGPKKVAREMAATLDMARSRAELIARTEMLRAYREGNSAQWQANQHLVAEWIWLCAGGVRTCPVCFSMNGTRHPVSESLTSHPNCRCTMVPVPLAPEGIDGRGMTDAILNTPVLRPGDELLRSMSTSQQKAILGQARWEHWHSGTPLSDLVTDHWHPIYGNQRRLRPLRDLGDGPPVKVLPEAPKPRPTPPPPPPPPAPPPGLQLTEPYVKRALVEAEEEDVRIVTEDALAAFRQVGLEAPEKFGQPGVFRWQGKNTALGDHPEYGGWYRSSTGDLEMNAVGLNARIAQAEQEIRAKMVANGSDLATSALNAEARQRAIDRTRGEFTSYISHEYGHHIDESWKLREQLFGDAGGRAERQELLRLMDESRTIQNIRRSYLRGANGPWKFNDSQYRDYLLREQEMMARAFQQFMAEESGQKPQLRWTRSYDKTLWGKDEFQPIREAMRKWLKAAGWLT